MYRSLLSICLLSFFVSSGMSFADSQGSDEPSFFSENQQLELRQVYVTGSDSKAPEWVLVDHADRRVVRLRDEESDDGREVAVLLESGQEGELSFRYQGETWTLSAEEPTGPGDIVVVQHPVSSMEQVRDPRSELNRRSRSDLMDRVQRSAREGSREGSRE